MPRLAVGVEFLTEFAKLDPPVRRRTVEALEKFGEHTHAGLHLEKLAGVRDERVRTIRITQYWRGVVLAPTSGDRYVLLRVLGHDEAIDWARRHRFSVNEVSGVLEVRDVAALEALAGAETVAGTGSRQLFADVSDGDLRKLGIDAQVLAAARTIADEDELDKIAPLLPDAQSDVLYGLASGMAVEQVWADIVAPRIPAEPIDVDDLARAAERTQGRIALVDGPDELLALFDKPFALWRVFLHPSQEKIAYRPSYWGSAQVSGGPGTGKTVAALHRVKHLAATRDLPPRSILLTTFSRALAESLDRDLTRLLDPDERPAVEVLNVDRWAHGVVRAEHGALRMAGEDELVGHLDEVAPDGFSPAFLLDEWRHVVLGHDLPDVEAYLAVSRRGRGRRLTPAQRRQLWSAIEAFVSRLREHGGWTHLTVAAEATRLVAARREPPFRHVVVDEIQDLHPVQWRLLRAAVPVGPDDLFLAGDPHQRIYGNRVSLRQVGITVTGRSTRLRINYRTSAEILEWALGMLGDTAIADLDEGLDTLAGYRSTLHGEPPELAGAASPDDEAAALRRALHRWHDDGVAWRDMAVVARTARLARRLTRDLGVATTDLHADSSDASEDTDSEGAVRVGTMHGMKGLEFRCVAVVGAGRAHLPNRHAVVPATEDPVRNALDLQQERCLLFVACTRARERLRVSWSGRPSTLLPDGQAAGS